jgi:hypothetical protein
VSRAQRTRRAKLLATAPESDAARASRAGTLNEQLAPTMKTPIRHYLAALAILAACTPFTPIENTPGTTTEGGLPGDAGGESAEGGNEVPMPDAGSGSSDGGSIDFDADADAGPKFQYVDGGFCAGFANPIFCYDFDENQNPPPGLTVTGISNGAISYAPTFATGSMPTALTATATAPMARVTVTSPTIVLSKYPSSTIEIDVGFQAGSTPTAIEYVARLNFAAEVDPISFNSADGFQCGANTYSSFPAGVHRLVLTVVVNDLGTAVSWGCKVDNTELGSVSLTPRATLAVELGNANAGAPFSVTYDDFVARVQ